MALLSIKDVGVIEALIELPRLGAWTADLVIDTDSPPSGQVTVEQDGGPSFTGTIIASRAGAPYGSTFLRLVGGAGGLNKDLDPRGYFQPTIGHVAKDLLGDAGETSSSSSDQSVSSTELDFWARIRGPGARQLTALAQEVPKAIWRVLLDGTVFLGFDGFNDFKQDHQVLDPIPTERRHTLGVEAFQLQPGVSFDGEKVANVLHSLQGGVIRTHYWTID